MTWPTHTLLGISTLWLLVWLPPEALHYDLGVLAIVAAFGALLPDLHASDSKIKHLEVPNTNVKPFMLPALVVSGSDQHRGLLHSLAGLSMVAVMCGPDIGRVGWAPLVALLLGYASHLIDDSATKSGIRLLYPKNQRFHLLPLEWRQ